MNSTPLRIAHGYGNHRQLLERALIGPVDLIEADIWHRVGQFWVRHERRLIFPPMLYDNRPRHKNPLGAYTIPIGPRWYIRPDIRPVRLAELLEKAKGKRKLLLDLKGGYGRLAELSFAESLANLLVSCGMEEEAYICGQNWSLLDRVREVAPQLQVRFSIERPTQWQNFSRRLAAGERIDGICLHRALMNGDMARFLGERSIEAFCWTVNEPQEASRLLALDVAGIISDDLLLLGSLEAPASTPEEANS